MRVQLLAIATAVIEDKCLVWGCRASIYFLFLHLIFSEIVTATVKKGLNDCFSSRTAPLRVQFFAIATAVYKDKCLVWGCRASI
jgi:hypothetical protein